MLSMCCMTTLLLSTHIIHDSLCNTKKNSNKEANYSLKRNTRYEGGPCNNPDAAAVEANDATL
ncbi:unnamed protein product [Larinioides sclopetarius]|uniref:Uncharacterized protein n=1 Tax=Larinioides sclopetarius TaxID=280406 RepID=A0AAV2A922_9ARAC